MYNYEERKFTCDNCGKQVKDNDQIPGWIQIQRDGLDDFMINFTTLEHGKIKVKEIRDLSELDFCCPKCFWNWCKSHV